MIEEEKEEKIWNLSNRDGEDGSTHLGVGGPKGRRALAEKRLVRGVGGQKLGGRHDDRGLRLVGHRRQVPRLGVAPQLPELRRALLWNQPPRHGGMVGHKPRVLVLAEIHRSVVTRRDPHYCGQNLHHIGPRVGRHPPLRVSLVAVAYAPHLVPPPLQLRVFPHHLIGCVH